MKNILIIGGMGAGKSSATRALASQGLPIVDLDQLGHVVLTWDSTKEELSRAYGARVFTAQGDVDRAALAAVAFATSEGTETLNRITQPRIDQALHNELARLAAEGHTAAVIESSSFTGQAPLVALADYIVVVTAPEELRVARAVAAGWSEADVRARMARQLTDEQRLRFATVSFVNDGTPEQLYDQVVSWWNAEKEQL